MPQKKLKAKAKLPKEVKANKKTAKKGSAITKRANRPVQPKKKGIAEARKLKQTVNKAVNKAVEEEIRAKAVANDNKPLSKAQQAVAEHNKASAQ